VKRTFSGVRRISAGLPRQHTHEADGEKLGDFRDAIRALLVCHEALRVQIANAFQYQNRVAVRPRAQTEGAVIHRSKIIVDIAL
jgi:hypothetical protein